MTTKIVTLYPTKITGTTGHSVSHHTQVMSNKQNLCSGNKELAWWGVKNPTFLGNYMRNWPDSLCSISGTFHEPETIYASGFKLKNVDGDSLITKIKVSYKWEQVSYSSTTAFGKFEKPTISVMKNSKILSSAEGAKPAAYRYNNNKTNTSKMNLNNAELKDLHSHTFNISNKNFKIKDLNKLKIKFNPKKNTSHNHLRIIMQFIRIELTYQEPKPTPTPTPKPKIYPKYNISFHHIQYKCEKCGYVSNSYINECPICNERIQEVINEEPLNNLNMKDNSPYTFKCCIQNTDATATETIDSIQTKIEFDFDNKEYGSIIKYDDDVTFVDENTSNNLIWTLSNPSKTEKICRNFVFTPKLANEIRQNIMKGTVDSSYIGDQGKTTVEFDILPYELFSTFSCQGNPLNFTLTKEENQQELTITTRYTKTEVNGLSTKINFDYSAFETPITTTTDMIIQDNNSYIQGNQISINGDEEIIEGYYYHKKFYEDPLQNTEIIPETNKIYLDIQNEQKYKYQNGYFFLILNEENNEFSEYINVVCTQKIPITKVGKYNIYITKEDDLSTIEKEIIINVTADYFDKEYFKIRVEDGSDIQYNSLIITTGDDFLTPLTYELSDENSILDYLDVEGIDKRIPLKTVEYISFKLKLNPNINYRCNNCNFSSLEEYDECPLCGNKDISIIPDKLEYKNVIGKLNISSNGEKVTGILQGANNSITFPNSYEDTFIIDEINSEKEKIIRFAVISDEEKTCKASLSILGEEKDSWRPSNIEFKDIPSIKLGIDGPDDISLEQSYYECQGEECQGEDGIPHIENNPFDVCPDCGSRNIAYIDKDTKFTLTYTVQNLSNIDGGDLKFKIIEPDYFKKSNITINNNEENISSFNPNTNIWHFTKLYKKDNETPIYSLSIEYIAKKKGIFDFILKTLDNETTLEDDQLENEVHHNIMIGMNSDVIINTYTSKYQTEIDDLIDFKINIKNLFKQQKNLNFIIKDIGEYEVAHNKNHYEIESIDCEYGQFIPEEIDSEDGIITNNTNLIGTWKIPNAGINKEYELILSLRPKETGIHTIQTDFLFNNLLSNTFKNEVKVLTKKKNIDFDFYQAVNFNNIENPKCDDLIRICDDDFISPGEEIYFVFEITNNEINDIENIDIFTHIGEKLITENLEELNRIGAIVEQNSGNFKIHISNIKAKESIKKCVRIVANKNHQEILHIYSYLSAWDSYTILKRLKLTITPTFIDRKLEHEINIYNFDKTNKYYRYELDKNENIIKFFSKNQLPLRNVETEQYNKNAIETYKGTNLKKIYEQIKEKSKYVDPEFLRIGNNQLKTKGYELYPDGFIRRFGLLNSEIFHYAGQLPKVTNLVDYAMIWDENKWDEKIWGGGDYSNGAFDLTIDYSKIPTNFLILESKRPLKTLQKIVDHTKPYGTKGFCYYSSNIYLDMNIDLEMNNFEIENIIPIDLILDNDGFGLISWYKRMDNSIFIDYDLSNLKLNDINNKIKIDIDKICIQNNKLCEPNENIYSCKKLLNNNNENNTYSIEEMDMDISCYVMKKEDELLKDTIDKYDDMFEFNDFKNFQIEKDKDYLINNTEGIETTLINEQLDSAETSNDIKSCNKTSYEGLPINDFQYIFSFNTDIDEDLEYGISLENQNDIIRICRLKDSINKFNGFKLYLNDDEIGETNYQQNIYDYQIIIQRTKNNYLHFFTKINNNNFVHIGYVKEKDAQYQIFNLYNLKIKDSENGDIYILNNLEKVINDTSIIFKIRDIVRTIKKSPSSVINIDNKNKWWDLKYLNSKNNDYCYFENKKEITPINTPLLLLKYEDFNIDDLDKIKDISLKIKAKSNKSEFLDDVKINILKNGDYYIPNDNMSNITCYPDDINIDTQRTIFEDSDVSYIGIDDLIIRGKNSYEYHLLDINTPLEYNDVINIIEDFNININITDLHKYNYYYCPSCNSLGIGNYDRCPNNNCKNIFKIENYHDLGLQINIYAYYPNANKIKKIYTITEYNNIIEQSIKIQNLYQDYNEMPILKLYVELDKFEENVQYINSLPVKKQDKDAVIEQFKSTDNIIINNIKQEIKYKNNQEPDESDISLILKEPKEQWYVDDNIKKYQICELDIDFNKENKDFLDDYYISIDGVNLNDYQFYYSEENGIAGLGSKATAIKGYYNNINFYYDSIYQEQINGEIGKLYLDLNTDLLYIYTKDIIINEEGEEVKIYKYMKVNIKMFDELKGLELEVIAKDENETQPIYIKQIDKNFDDIKIPIPLIDNKVPTLYINLQNKYYEKQNQIINELKVEDQYKELLLNNIPKINIFINKIEINKKFKQIVEYDNTLDVTKIHIPGSQTFTNNIQVDFSSHYFLLYDKKIKSAKINITGVNYDDGYGKCYINNDDLKQELVDYVPNGYFDIEYDLLNSFDIEDLENPFNIQFTNLHPNTDLYLKDIHLNISFENKSNRINTDSYNIFYMSKTNDIYTIPNVNGSIKTLSKNLEYLIELTKDSLWNFEEDKPGYLDGKQLKNNLVVYLDFGELNTNEYIHLYDIDLILSYINNKAEYVTEQIIVQDSKKMAKYLNGNFKNGLLFGKLQNIEKVFDNEMLDTGLLREDNVINNIPLNQNIYQPFSISSNRIDGITLRPYSKVGYPNSNIEISIYDSKNNLPNNIIYKRYIDGWNNFSEDNIYIDLPLNIIPNQQYWIKISSNGDKYNYYTLGLNTNISDGSLYIEENNIKVRQDYSLDFGIYSINDVYDYNNFPQNIEEEQGFKIYNKLYRYNETQVPKLSNINVKFGQEKCQQYEESIEVRDIEVNKNEKFEIVCNTKNIPKDSLIKFIITQYNEDGEIITVEEISPIEYNNDTEDIIEKQTNKVQLYNSENIITQNQYGQEYTSIENFPKEGDKNKRYLNTVTNILYYWDGTTYVRDMMEGYAYINTTINDTTNTYEIECEYQHNEKKLIVKSNTANINVVESQIFTTNIVCNNAAYNDVLPIKYNLYNSDNNRINQGLIELNITNINYPDPLTIIYDLENNKIIDQSEIEWEFLPSINNPFEKPKNHYAVQLQNYIDNDGNKWRIDTNNSKNIDYFDIYKAPIFIETNTLTNESTKIKPFNYDSKIISIHKNSTINTSENNIINIDINNDEPLNNIDIEYSFIEDSISINYNDEEKNMINKIGYTTTNKNGQCTIPLYLPGGKFKLKLSIKENDYYYQYDRNATTKKPVQYILSNIKCIRYDTEINNIKLTKANGNIYINNPIGDYRGMNNQNIKIKINNIEGLLGPTNKYGMINYSNSSIYKNLSKNKGEIEFLLDNNNSNYVTNLKDGEF